jgi:hypothetical protein
MPGSCVWQLGLQYLLSLWPLLLQYSCLLRACWIHTNCE